jgi:hypothetical protein
MSWVEQELLTGRWFFPDFSTNKTNCHNIAEILLKVALNTTALTQACCIAMIFLYASYSFMF